MGAGPRATAPTRRRSRGSRSRRSPARSATRCRRAAIRSSPPASRSRSRRSSQNKEAAYLFIQWLNSKDVSLERVQLPYALRDPFRESHFASEEYKSRWPEAPDYLAALQAGAVTGLLDLSLIQTDRYEEALRQGFSRLWARRGSAGDPRRHRRALGRDDRADRRRQAEGGLRRLGVQAQRLPELSVPRAVGRPRLTAGRVLEGLRLIR